MTDLAVYQEPTAALIPAAVAPQQGGAQALTEWVNAARLVVPLAQSLASTSFVPRAFAGKPHEIAAAILAGSEVGMSPMAALRSVDIIEGKPSFSAIALRALILAHGHAVWVEESNDSRAVVAGRRRDSDKVQRSVWTMDKAKKAGLSGKSNWQKHPAAMLVARASAEVCRLVGADVIAGMPYASEELRDGVDAPFAAADAYADQQMAEDAANNPPAGTRRMSRRKPEPTPEPEPAAEAEQPEPVGTEQGITSTQMKALQAGFKAIGVTDRTERLDTASNLIGRDITSANDLTRREAGTVLDYLDREQNGVAVDEATGEVLDNAGYEPETDES